MKSKIKNLSVLLALMISSLIISKQASAQGPQVSIQFFYDQLSPYGQWVDYPNYGYVWLPDEAPDFVPYSTRGHWIFTDYGWTWASDYEWGWAPFHYGRWDYDNYYGWFWIPDTEWAPAWVSWRRADGYYGWAPMEPGISISVSFGRGYDSHNDHWIFVQDRYIDRSDVNQYYVNRNDHDRIIRNSTVINNTYVDRSRNTTYISGPGREDIQKVTGRRFNPVPVREYNKPGQDMSNGQFRIYRPQVVKNNDREQKPAPSRLTNLRDVKQPSERRPTNQQGRDAQPQQNAVKPQDTNAKPAQPVNANPERNPRKEPQQNAVKPQDTNAKPAQPVNANPERNPRKEPQQNAVKPQNTNAKPAQPVNANPERNPRTEPQQNAVKPQNTNAKPPQPVNANPSQNKRTAPAPRTVKQSKPVTKEQPTNSNPKKDKGKKD